MTKWISICALLFGFAATAAETVLWTDRIEFSGDIRYRHEYVNKTKPTDTADSHRERLRVRFGAQAKINDQVKAKFRLTTSDGANPLGPNTTFTDNASKKSIYVDIGAIEWTMMEGTTFILGKMENPLRVMPQSQLIYDIDYTPEGAALAWLKGPLFVKAAGYSIQERSQQADGTSEPDSWLLAGMAGYKVENPDGLGYMVMAGYHNFTALKKNAALPLGSTTGNFYGNSNVGGRYVHDYQVGELAAEARLTSAGQMWVAYADFANNFYTDEHNRALLVGMSFHTLNENRKPIWTLGYSYETVEKDATVSNINYSDIANGYDGHFGHIFQVGRAVAANTTITVTFTHAYLDNNGRPYWADRGLLDAVFSF